MPAEFCLLIGLDPKGVMYVLEGGQQLGFSVYQCDIVFKMGAGFSVRRQDGPSVLKLANPACAHIDHGFDGHHHSFYEFLAPSPFPIVGHFRGFMQLFSEAMAYQFPHNPVTVVLAVFLDRIAHIADTVAKAELPNTDIQGFPGDVKKFAPYKIF